ncbi:MAG: ComEC/Rec2 family competence protein [Parcubacteria group bacterium]|nr:ComEC/Rec2 family competence protein [Parcubacteria group bacterium]
MAILYPGQTLRSASLGFLGGVAIASLFLLSLSTLFIAALLAVTIFLFWRASRVVLLAGIVILFAIIGAWYAERSFERLATLKGVIGTKGVVVSNPEVRGNRQEFILNTKEGRLLIRTGLYPSYQYGNRLNVAGEFESLTDEYGVRTYRRLLVTKSQGALAFPEIEKTGEGGGSQAVSTIYRLRERVLSILRDHLPEPESSFAQGLLVGERAELPKNFREALSKSGTTHLIAVSGYNVSLVTQYLFTAFLIFFPSRRTTLVPTLLALLGFVLITGAASSVIRAAIMGMVVLLARELGRASQGWHFLVLTALAMVLVNPAVFAFDLGFQLSFLAMGGMVLVAPLIKRYLVWMPQVGFLSLRDNLTNTIAAQITVLPILLSSFGTLSLIAIPVNLAVLPFIPLAMLLSLLLFLATLVAGAFASVVGVIAYLPLTFVTRVIAMSGSSKLAALTVPDFPGWIAILLYGILAIWLLSEGRRKYARLWRKSSQ